MFTNPDDFEAIAFHKLEFYERLSQVGSKLLDIHFIKAPPGSVHHALKTIMQDTGRIEISKTPKEAPTTAKSSLATLATLGNTSMQKTD